MTVPILGATLFVSAFLLFWCEPMVAKMLLPLVGGSASVWTTCVLFFQIMLLAGYVYAHLLAKTVRLRGQFLVHGALMLFALAFLPIKFVQHPALSTERPVTWLLGYLVTTMAVPFLVVSTTTPLLQSWLSRTRISSRRDPYFLYAASNTGSLLSLLVYPLIMEPSLGLTRQSWLWSAGYALLLVMAALAVFMVWKHSDDESSAGERESSTASLSFRTRLHWLAAAFVPSALMLAVTNRISLNLGSVPFLWIIPLAVYLLTFILAFSRGTSIHPAHLSRWSPILFLLMLSVVPETTAPSTQLNWWAMVAHIGILFFGAFLCHTALAARRPGPEHLTEFYFWLALGGALGGVFTTIVAPALFTTIFEYPLLVAALAFFREAYDGKQDFVWKDWLYPGILAVLFFLDSWLLLRVSRLDITDTYAVLVPDAIFYASVFMFRNRRLRFALGFAVLVIGYALTMPEYMEDSGRIYAARNFFGIKKVINVDPNMRKLLHGDTMHGLQSLDPDMSAEPLSYYHRTGPVGDVMQAIAERPNQHIGAVGLGTGTVAAYAGPSRHITFFDVDPQVKWIAENFFTYLRRCGSNCDVVIADGRLAIEQAPDHSFDLLLLDAFSSDSIPPHLISREAITIYGAKLKIDGLLLIHVSNRYLDVAKLAGAVLKDARFIALFRSDRELSAPGKSGSDYILASNRIEDFGVISTDPAWEQYTGETGAVPWTDDYSSMLSLVRWWGR